MANTVRSKRGDVSEQMSSVANDLQEMGASARRMAGDSVEAFRDTANEYLEEGRARVRELSDTVQTRIQDQPMTSILVATAVGFLLGVLWVRR